MATTHSPARRLLTTALVALVVAVPAGCADDSKSSSASVPAEVPQDDASRVDTDREVVPALTGGDAPAATVAPAGSPAGGLPDVVAGADGRKLVIVMTIGVEVVDAAASVDAILDLADVHGGQLYDSSLDLGDPASASGDLVFKLPPEEVDGFLRGLEDGIGRRTGLYGTTNDVAAQLTDLDAQILTARKSVERVRALLDAAGDLGEVITLEGELTTRETHLEQLLAQQSGLEAQVALATVTVHLTTAPVAPAAVDDGKETDTGIGAAFRAGWTAFVTVLVSLARMIGYTAPFLLLAALVGVPWWRVNRRRRQVATQRNRSAAPPPPPAPDADPRTSTPDSAVAARTP